MVDHMKPLVILASLTVAFTACGGDDGVTTGAQANDGDATESMSGDVTDGADSGEAATEDMGGSGDQAGGEVTWAQPVAVLDLGADSPTFVPAPNGAQFAVTTGTIGQPYTLRIIERDGTVSAEFETQGSVMAWSDAGIATGTLNNTVAVYSPDGTQLNEFADACTWGMVASGPYLVGIAGTEQCSTNLETGETVKAEVDVPLQGVFYGSLPGEPVIWLDRLGDSAFGFDPATLAPVEVDARSIVPEEYGELKALSLDRSSVVAVAPDARDAGVLYQHLMRNGSPVGNVLATNAVISADGTTALGNFYPDGDQGAGTQLGIFSLG